MAWTTPYAQQQCSTLEASLPPALLDKAYHATHSTLAPSTQSVYGAGLLRFTQFCDSWKISEQDRMPASAVLLTAFTSQCAGSYLGKTINSWLADLRLWHILNRAPWYGNDDWVCLARTTAGKQGTAFKRPLWAPVSLEHLHTLRRSLDITDPFHAAVWATALTTFFGCQRLGETTVKSLASFDPAFHVTCNTPVSKHQLSNGSSSMSLRIPCTKTTKQEGASITLTSREDDLCPVAAICNHLAISKDAPATMSFFAYQNPDGSFSHMFRGTDQLSYYYTHISHCHLAHFLDAINGIWQQASLDHVSGHSFCIGGAVTLLLAGVPPEVVAATGGWTSLAFLLYWRHMEEIIPLSTSNAYNRSQLTFLATTFEQFRICNNFPLSALSQ